VNYDKTTIDTIIFDLGQVIVDLDGQAVINEFDRLSGGKTQDLKELMIGSDFFFDYETGKIDELEYVDQFNLAFNTNISHSEFKHAWNLMIKAIPANRIDFMEALKQNFQVLVLSNTNSMHEDKFEQMMEDQFGFTMRSLAHTAYYSHDIQLRKPDLEIYNFVIEDQSINPARSLFLDDKPENILAAREVGLNAEVVKFPDQIFEIITNG
jgi:HAD superfamily hydrolase (TIGR01509 family)